MSIAASTERNRFLSRLNRDFAVSLPEARSIIAHFHRDMRRGLRGKKSSLAMLPSFAGRPRGNEKGRFIALDLGGTNCRVLEVDLDGKRTASITAVSRFAIPREVMQGEGAALFDFLAGCLVFFFRKNSVPKRRKHALGFTFSFPLAQRSLASGTLLRWTKEFRVSGVEGSDVAALLSAAMERRGLKSIRLAALTNDTVGTLLAGCYADPACDMGVILGTGTNACYLEQSGRIHRTGEPGRSGEMIVNLEWGNFNGLRTNRYDDALDAASLNPGGQRLEKMVSALHLGEIARLAIREMMEERLLFRNDERSHFSEPYGLTTEGLSLLARDRQAFFTRAHLAEAAEADRDAVFEIGRLVTDRSARIAGAAIAAVLTWMDPDLKAGHTVAVDGSLFVKYPGYRARIMETLGSLRGEGASVIRLVPIRDGSGVGSAIAGALADTAK
jgi:hexokinase